MKKIIAILCLILTACSSTPKEEKFVNPIFYKPLESFSKYPELYKITSNKLFRQNCFGYNTTVNCEILENTMDTMVLKCLHTPEPEGSLVIAGDTPQVWTYKFYIWPPEEQTSDLGTYIRVYKYLGDEYEKFKDNTDEISYSNLFIYYSPKDYMDIWGDAVNTFDENKGIDNTKEN